MDPAPRPEKEINVNRWTPEKEATLLREVREGPLEPDWGKISTTVGQAEHGCKLKYRELVTPEEEVEFNSHRVSERDIIALLQDNYKKCDTCSMTTYSEFREWRGATECMTCYSRHREEHAVIWSLLEPYTHCVICERGRDNAIPFHYDHLNMFDKGDSICSMVWRGAPVEDIKAEILKCQVMCKSCHVVVTRLENLLGFRRAKLHLTRSVNGSLKDGEDLSPEMKIAEQEKYRSLYELTVVPLYPEIKRLIFSKQTSEGSGTITHV